MPVPSSLALTSIADGASATAAPLRNNFSSIQSAVNALIAFFDGASPGDALVYDGTDWAPAAPTAATTYHKTTSKDVVNSIVQTDLLNLSITIGAGVMGANGAIHARLYGDLLFNNNAADTLRMKIVLGGTTLLDTGAVASFSEISATRRAWELDFLIQNMGFTNSQATTARFLSSPANAETTGTGQLLFTTGNGTQLFGVGYGTSAVDTTSAQALQVLFTWGTASVNNSMRLQGAFVQIN